MTVARRRMPARAHVLAGTCMVIVCAACGDAAPDIDGGTDVGPAPTRQAAPGIPFDPASARPGDVVGDMVLEHVSAERTVVDSTHVGTARFAGLVELSGRTVPHVDADLRAQSVCFEADTASAAQLPRWRYDERRPWFCFENPEDATLLEDGARATIVIDRFTIERNLSDAVNGARLASVVRVSDADAGSYPSVSCDGLERSILAAEPTRAGLRAASGAPVTVNVTTEPNRHVEGAIDSLFTVRYRDVVVRLRRPPSGRDMAEHVSITGSRWTGISGLGIGASAAQVIGILGEPTARRPDALVYDCGEHTEQPVTFHLDRDAVARIEISYYVD